MNERDLVLDGYGIDRDRYRELKNFCRQYPKWREELESGPRPRRENNLPAVLRQSHGIGDPTGNEAVRRIELQDKCAMIEQAAIWADGGEGLYECIIQNVAYGISVECLPCGKNKLSKPRRKFFYILDYMRQ